MVKYKLLEAIAGKPVGFEVETDKTHTDWEYKGNAISLKLDSELFEKVEKPIICYSREDLVYFGGKKEPMYEGEKVNSYYHIENEHLSFDSWNVQEYNFIYQYHFFKTLQAGKDYQKLLNVQKEYGLKIGDNLGTASYKNWIAADTKELNIFESTGSFSNVVIEGFIIYKDVIYVKIGAYGDNRLKYLIDICNFTAKSKLTFGGKDVKLTKKSEDIEIESEGAVENYTYIKEYFDTLEKLKSFQLFDYSTYSKVGQSYFDGSYDSIKVGCTTGTKEEIENIMKACEELLLK